MSKEIQNTTYSKHDAKLPVMRSFPNRHRYLAGKVREHLNAVGYDLGVDTESLIAQVLEVDGNFFDENIGCNDA